MGPEIADVRNNVNNFANALAAKRLQRGESSGPTEFANLWVKPKTSIEALTVAKLVRNVQGVQLDTDTGTSKFAAKILKAA